MALVVVVVVVVVVVWVGVGWGWGLCFFSPFFSQARKFELARLVALCSRNELISQ